MFGGGAADMTSGLQTTCPACGTIFRVTQAQLDLRQGLVRCGQCRFVFNAIDSLLDAQAGVDEVSEPVAFEFLALTGSDRSDVLRNPDRMMLDTVPDLGLGGRQITVAASPLPRASRSVWTWLSVVVLMALLMAQTMFWMRNMWVTWQPEWRPWIARICAPLECTVDLARISSAVHIDASALESLPGNESRLVVNFSNHAGQPMPWPHFLLTLKDADNRLLARRAITPAEYLGAAEPHVFAQNRELEIRLRLALGDLHPDGYEVRAAFP